MNRSGIKIVTLIFLIIIAGLIITHYVIVSDARAEFSDREEGLVAQVSALQNQLDDLVNENRALQTRLGIEGIRVEILRSNFGTALERVDEFNSMLAENGCRKLDQLYPIFEELKAGLEANRENPSLSSLDRIAGIIFAE